jgi:hypothetical protein
MSAKKHRDTLRSLQRDLERSLYIMMERVQCCHCAIPSVLRDIAISLWQYSWVMVDAANTYDEKYARMFTIRFFYKVASWTSYSFNQFRKYHTQLLDCIKWVDVAVQLMAVL